MCITAWRCTPVGCPLGSQPVSHVHDYTVALLNHERCTDTYDSDMYAVVVDCSKQGKRPVCLRCVAMPVDQDAASTAMGKRKQRILGVHCDQRARRTMPCHTVLKESAARSYSVAPFIVVKLNRSPSVRARDRFEVQLARDRGDRPTH